jgi:signal transduction histidine kinase
VLAVGIVFLPFFSPSDSGQASPDTYLLLLLGFGVGVAAQIYRYLNTSNYPQRQQTKTKWVVYGVAMALVGQFAFMVLDSFVPASLLPPDLKATPYNLIDVTGVTLAYLLIPLSIGVSVFRHQLWDIERVVNRTLVYAALTACIIGGYGLLVGGLGTLIQARGNFFLSLVATGFIAVLFQPLREWLQKGVNRFMYGERDDPYAVLSKLNARLGSVLEPASILPTVVQTIAETLKLPYVALTIREGDSFTLAASTGTSVGDALTLPLLHQHEAVGHLLLGLRGGERFSVRGEKLFSDLAHQAAEAVQAVRLNAELQRSRQRLVTLREEERRRIRRDLHDGLGPTLVGINLQAGALLKLMADNAEAQAVVSDLRGEIRKAIADIRHLVY